MKDLKSLVEIPIESDSVNTQVANPKSMTTENTDAELEVVEEVTELSIPTEEVAVKTEEVIEEATEETEEVEEVEEVLEEELPEEVVEEVAEATEEESPDVEVAEKTVPNGEEVLLEVANGLTNIEASMKNLLARLDETESLKALVAEHEATILSLTEEKTVAETEAAVELEVGKRVAERLVEIGVEPTPITADRKSIAARTPVLTETKVKTGVTRFDPQPAMTDGMTGLGSWLSDRLGDRGQ